MAAAAQLRPAVFAAAGGVRARVPSALPRRPVPAVRSKRRDRLLLRAHVVDAALRRQSLLLRQSVWPIWHGAPGRRPPAPLCDRRCGRRRGPRAAALPPPVPAAVPRGPVWAVRRRHARALPLPPEPAATRVQRAGLDVRLALWQAAALRPLHLHGRLPRRSLRAVPGIEWSAAMLLRSHGAAAWGPVRRAYACLWGHMRRPGTLLRALRAPLRAAMPPAVGAARLRRRRCGRGVPVWSRDAHATVLLHRRGSDSSSGRW